MTQCHNQHRSTVINWHPITMTTLNINIENRPEYLTHQCLKLFIAVQHLATILTVHGTSRNESMKALARYQITGWSKKTKLSFFVHIFAKYWSIHTIFSPVYYVINWLLIGMHTTPTMSLHYLVKHKYLKTNNIKTVAGCNFVNYVITHNYSQLIRTYLVEPHLGFPQKIFAVLVVQDRPNHVEF